MTRDTHSFFSAARSRGGLITAGCLAAAIGLVSLGGGIAVAADGGGLAPPAVDPATVAAPTAVPDRVILTPTETPETSQHVNWRTSTEVTTPRVQFALSGPSPVDAASATTVEASSTTEFSADLGYGIRHHSATMTGLEPDQTYLYRVGDGETWSEWLEFTTATVGASEFSFLVQGDAQNDNKAYTSRAFRAAFEARPYAELVVHAGDLIDTETSDAEWGEWHEAAAFANQYMNVVAATGNHEYYPGPELSEHWGAQFEYPKNGPDATPEIQAALSETVYYVDYQGVRFIALNSTQGFSAAQGAAQTEWLEAVLAENPNQWTVVTFHHPVFSVTSGRDNASLREMWLPLFEEYDVDLVVQGHDHAYGRGNLFANEQDLPAGADASTSHTGPVYLVSVAGPKMYVPDPADSNNWVANDANLRVTGRDVQLFQTVDVTADRMHVEARTVDGAVFDSFTISKDAEGEKLVYDDAVWAGGGGSTRDGVEAPSAPGGENPGGENPGGENPGGENPGGENPDGETASVKVSDGQLTPGEAFTVTAAGFQPREEVRIELHSDPVLLATVTADADGGVSQRVTVPRTAPAAEHTIVLIGQTSGIRAEVAVLVVQPSAAGSLQVAGANVGWLVGLGILFLGVGAVALRVGLRRPAAGGAR
ncbi:metallophosphoesterase family protein [Salinibacterium sp. SYSU T00001]|uniref:purple acid phosphatase family protein n=1 Tax=Homoserinimonas sedimenticola TaxID=2986805 RepID=UPI0022365425|nr:metallophosphoesterase family protein [Salinibacterium sedimenticola]MCW4385612.1 metallophosphoesterase family protein [Salinibacterium sedimenticola]